jgi:heme oxygenase (biliverdin-IX-beta and delta-forming)
MIISEEIKAFTAQSHRIVEKLITDQIRSIVTCKDYAHLLGLFLNYFGAVEILTDKHISKAYLPDARERRKTDLISQDLLSLKVNIHTKLKPELLPSIKDRYNAFGALYVIEGSTLGGLHISKMIRKRLPDLTNAFLFFEGYGERTIDMWNRFKNILDNIDGNQDEINGIIYGAQDTFLKFAEWINSNIKSKMLT